MSLSRYARARIERAIAAQDAVASAVIVVPDDDPDAVARIEAERTRAARAAAQMRARLAEDERRRDEAIQDAWRIWRETARRTGQADWLARLAMGTASVLTRAHLAAAAALRDHARGLQGGGSVAWSERVDGGRVHNGQLERLADRRRIGRAALDAACRAVHPVEYLPGVLLVVLDGRSLRRGLDACRLPHSGANSAALRDCVVQSLDAAVAYLGISRG